ncbi:hypothetical protein DPMN_188756 [Dreissena polymorpha]|uniref:Uncharacterized protein n=1 Tax=Dreissena polymorpha TaxID=45954 RepID=A0A9D4DSQ9_DREPO|nr:hypothetical protein DPMN_188756 [Dreissena polymorpha]
MEQVVTLMRCPRRSTRRSIVACARRTSRRPRTSCLWRPQTCSVYRCSQPRHFCVTMNGRGRCCWMPGWLTRSPAARRAE